MHFAELFFIAVGLSMDAFAVSVCKGLSVKKLSGKHALLVGLYFGGFQFLMPLLGWLLGSRFERAITSVDHWLAFGLLAIIGINMIQDAFGEGEKLDDDFGVKTMLMLAVATSIDALAVGITLAFLSAAVLPAAAMIGVTTFLLSCLGIWVGHAFGIRYRKGAELLGGVILILIGLKILLEHLGILSL